MRFSPNFQSHGTGINKVMHFFVNGINRVFLQANGPNLNVAFGLQQLAAPYTNGAGQTGTAVLLSPNLPGPASFVRGQWQRLDVVLVANTPGVADGSVQAFLDGRKVLRFDDIMFSAAGGGTMWEGMNWNPTWGGIGDIVAEEMYIQLDHIAIRGRN
jgi:hypothetical protein